MRLRCAARKQAHDVCVRLECRTHFARRKQCDSAESVLLSRVHPPRWRHARRILTWHIGVSAAAHVTPTAPRAARESQPQGSCFAKTCCSSLTRAPSCRFVCRATRSMSGECSSTLKPVFAWAFGLSRATDSFSSIGIQILSSTPSHEQLARALQKDRRTLLNSFGPASPVLSHYSFQFFNY